MELFRNETLEYFGGKGVKRVVWEYLIKKLRTRFVTTLWQKNHSAVVRSSWARTLIKKKVEMERETKNDVANGISSTTEYLLDWTCLL